MSEVKPVPVQIEPKRDVWEKIGALSPLLCGLLISAFGTYCTYVYNQQQLKIQQVQTIGSFIPHLMGNEQSKKASILALYTMTNSQTASKFAQIFASSGTVSALQSITKNGNAEDKAIAHEALSTTLQNLAQQEALSKAENEYEKKLIGLKNSGKNNSYTAYNMNKLAQIYIMRGQYDLAEPLLEQALALRLKLYGATNPEICDSLRGLAEVYFMTNRVDKAQANIQQVRSIEEKFAANTKEAVAINESAKDELKNGSQPNTAADQSMMTQASTTKSAENDSNRSDGQTSKETDKEPDQTKTQLSGSATPG